MTDSPAHCPVQADRIELVIAQLYSLPTLPAIATRILQLTTASQSNARQVVELIQSDQSLTAKVLSLARRAELGIKADVLTVERAVVLMGFGAIRNAVLSIKVFETFGIKNRRTGQAQFDRTEFWKHSLAVACAAQLLAEHLPGRIDPEEAFVCGLLHDLGKVALDACLPKSYQRVVRLAVEKRACIADVERQILGIDHAVAGRRLGQRWQLPQALVDSMWLHHHEPQALPRGLATARLVQLVHLADLVAREQRIGFSGNFVYPVCAGDVAQGLGVRPGDLQRVLQELPGRIEQRASIIGLGDLSSQSLYIRAVAQANQELGQLNQSLAETNRALTRRSRYFQALGELTSGVWPTASIAELSVAAAAAIRTALQVPAALVCTLPDQPPVSYVGFSGGQRSETDILDASEVADLQSGLGPAGASGPGSVCLIPANPQAQNLLARYGQKLGPGPYWFLPIFCHERLIAYGLFAASNETVNQHRSESAELAAFSAALGLAIANAQVRAASQQLAEDLAEANRQLQQAQSQLLHSRALRAIAEMASGAAHELNNPLAVIAGRAQLLRERTSDDGLREMLDTICRHAHRCSQIVSELMSFAKPCSPQPQHFALGQLLEKLRATWLARAGLQPDQFVLRLPADLPQPYADPGQVEQILHELLANAIQSAPPDRLRLVVNCQADVADESVALAVEDNGCGMDQAVLEKAFDPFFSHQQAGRRTGLGLARAARLAETNSARLWLQSQPGVGTTAYLQLPTVPARQSPAAAVR